MSIPSQQRIPTPRTLREPRALPCFLLGLVRGLHVSLGPLAANVPCAPHTFGCARRRRSRDLPYFDVARALLPVRQSFNPFVDRLKVPDASQGKARMRRARTTTAKAQSRGRIASVSVPQE